MLYYHRNPQMLMAYLPERWQSNSKLALLFLDFGGFFLGCEDFARMLDHSFPACTFSCFCFLK